MKKRQREAIIISFLREKEKYRKLANHIVQMIQNDPASPKESLHTIIYRIKDELRLIEKIDKHNKELTADSPSITAKNFKLQIGDLLGVRIICLRLSDIRRVQTYLELLSEEKMLLFRKGPTQKRSFILPVGSGETVSGGIDLGSTGYSSIHYQVELGENSDAPSELKNIQFELQLRTILEEAWGEIDHKYRYVHTRSDIAFPEYVHTGFYNFSAFLQVAALQAEDLCRLAEAHRQKNIPRPRRISPSPLDGKPVMADTEKPEAIRKPSPSEIENRLKIILRFKVTPRTLVYVEKRLGDFWPEEKPHKTLQKLFTKNRLAEFKAIFQEILDAEPFTKGKERNIDVINALNFFIFYELQGKKVAQEGLMAVLKWRKERSAC